MYLAQVHLHNWRSYADAQFTFQKPETNRGLVLIGAMNGHGKTSLLISLYLGLFGRHGLRFVEGLRDDSDTSYYRDEIAKVRRWATRDDDPTFVDIIFSPTEGETHHPEIRIRRIWHFDPQGRPLHGESFEEVLLWRDQQPLKLLANQDNGQESWKDTLEGLLFPAQFLPAFFFDGEQAQRMIFEGSAEHFQRDVAVLYGTAAVDDMREKLRRYASRVAQQAGGKRREDQRQEELRDLESTRDRVEQKRTEEDKSRHQLLRRRDDLERQRQDVLEVLTRLGGNRSTGLEQVQAEIDAADHAIETGHELLLESIKKLGSALAVVKWAPRIEKQLASEEIRERWVNVKTQTENQTEAVLAKALPEPPERDELLGFLSPEVRDRVRWRFRDAIQMIYHPPPAGCADEYLFGFATGDSRQRLRERLNDARRTDPSAVEASAKGLQDARERKREANYRLHRLSDLPPEIEQQRQRLDQIVHERDDVTRQLTEAESRLAEANDKLATLNKRIGELSSEIRNLAPEYQRIQVAESAAAALEALAQELRPLALNRLRERITHHFLRIADERFMGSKIVFHAGLPFLRRDGESDKPIQSMSGFERRAFGIAYSLALVESTGRRLPLVIDTPLGNADSHYRERLLAALTDVDLDQVIVLPHDAEVPYHILNGLSDRVRQTFLVQYDRERAESRVFPDQYFTSGGV